MTLEERVNKYLLQGHRYTPSVTEVRRESYLQGDADRLKIDVGKALKVYEELMTCSGYCPEAITAELARMRNKLEE